MPNIPMQNESKRQRYEKLRGQLDSERQSFMGHWRDLGDFVLPRRPRFTLQDINRGERRNLRIIDSTATLAARTLRAGMMGGLTSPARPWFKLSTPDSDLAEFGPVQDWLEDVTTRMRNVFLKSNLYRVLPITYGDMGVFATSCLIQQENFDRVIHFDSLPIGSYYLWNDDTGRVRGVFREFRMTVRQVVEKFGQMGPNGQPNWSNMSTFVKDSWENGNYEYWVDVAHVVQKNPMFDPKMLYANYKKFSSCYYERGSEKSGAAGYQEGPNEGRFLRESGYDYFPGLAPRWETTGEDVYGTDCPGMAALGDVKQLQTGEKRAAMAIDKMVNPPMTGPTVLRNQPSSLLPGGTTWVDTREGQAGFRPAHEVRFDINALEMKQAQVRQRVDKAFFVDLFLMMSQSDRREITAREVEERHEEKLLALGPVLEQTNEDLLDPLVDNTFDIMLRQGLIPPPPPELEGQQLKIEYVSVMAQAQKLVGIASLERFTDFVVNTANQTKDNSILDKVDMDQLVDEHAMALGVSPKVVRSDDEVGEIRQRKAEAAEAAANREAIPAAAKAAKDLAGADMSTDNALTRITNAAA